MRNREDYYEGMYHRKKSGAAVDTKHKIRNINMFLKMARENGAEVSREYKDIVKTMNEDLTKGGNLKQFGNRFNMKKYEMKGLSKSEIQQRKKELLQEKKKYLKRLNRAYKTYQNTILNRKTAPIIANFYNKIVDPSGIDMSSIIDFVKMRDANAFKALKDFLESSEVVEVIQRRQENRDKIGMMSLNDMFDQALAVMAGKPFDKILVMDYLSGSITLGQFRENYSKKMTTKGY